MMRHFLTLQTLWANRRSDYNQVRPHSALGLEQPRETLNMLIKKLFDIIFSSIFLAILAVPMILIAILIRINSKGPAIFSHERVCKNNKTFRCYKFRTMHKDADEQLNTFLENNEEARLEWDYHRKIKNDPRITKVGKFLRQTSLDELPQLFNVLKGEMSLVGPRPVTRRELDVYYKEMAMLCLSATPGITGLWQVSGRSNTSYDYRMSLDFYYVRNWNLWLDIVIFFKTFRVLMNKNGTY